MALRVRGFSRRGFRVGNKRVSYTNEAVVDPNDQHIGRRLLANAGAYYSPSEMLFPLAVAGGLSTGSTGLTLVAPRDLTISRVVATVGTAPTGTGNVTVDLHKVPAGGETTDAGTTIFATKPIIAVTTTISAAAPLADADWAAGDILRLEVDSIGGTIAGSDLRVWVYAS